MENPFPLRVGAALCRIIVLATALLAASFAARAGLTLEMNVIRYDYGSHSGYYFHPNLNTNDALPSVPFGDYYVASSHAPTNGSCALYQFTTLGPSAPASRKTLD
jgi:hypothetical protein